MAMHDPMPLCTTKGPNKKDGNYLPILWELDKSDQIEIKKLVARLRKSQGKVTPERDVLIMALVPTLMVLRSCRNFISEKGIFKNRNLFAMQPLIKNVLQPAQADLRYLIRALGFDYLEKSKDVKSDEEKSKEAEQEFEETVEEVDELEALADM